MYVLRNPTGKGSPGAVQVRPPAIVTEFMSLGSLRSALSRKAEAVQHPVTRLLIALDAAKVSLRRGRGCLRCVSARHQNACRASVSRLRLAMCQHIAAMGCIFALPLEVLSASAKSAAPLPGVSKL